MILVAAAALVAATLVFGFGAVDPQAPRWLVVHGFAAVLLVRWAAVTLRRGEIVLPAAFLWSLPFVLWAGASILWSPDPMEGLHQIKDGVALWVIALWASRHADMRALAPFIALALGAFLVMVWALPEDVHGGTGNQNFAAEMVLVALPFTLGWRAAPVLVAGLVYLLAVNGSIIEVSVIGVAAVALAWKCRARWLLLAALATVFVAVVALSPHAQDSLTVRAELWWNTAAMWLHRPFFGFGLGSYNYAYPWFQEAHLWLLGDTFIQGTDYPGHAHNEVLQVMAELGLVGLLLAGFGVWKLLRSPGPWPARACLLVVGALSLVEFPLHNASTGLIAALAAGMAAQPAEFMRVRLHWTARLPGGAIALSLAAAVVVAGTLSFTAERAFAVTYMTIKVRPVMALRANLHAYETYPLDRHYRHQLGLTFAVLVNIRRDQVRVTEDAADRIHGIALSAGPATATLLARLEFLFNTGRARTTEARQIVDYLSQRASLHHGTHRAMQVFSEM